VSFNFTIVIADRNRHVREFLKREFRLLGYQVHMAKDGWEVLSMAKSGIPPDLLILDPEIPFAEGLDIITQLRNRRPALPVVIHTFAEYDGASVVQGAAGLVEKRGDIQQLKTVVAETLQKWYPQRFGSTEKHYMPQKEDTQTAG
jgi:DNA-binding NtrC family response regulator